MRLRNARLFIFSALLAGGVVAAPVLQHKLEYPPAKRVDHVDVHHGVQVPDPYRWLEDAHSAETREWIKAQNEVTFAYLESIPVRPRIRQRLTELWNYEKYGVPFKQGGRYFFSKNDGLQNQSVLYTMERLDGPPELLLDPNKFSEDGTIALTNYEVSEDGKLVAYGISSGGSDWQEWKVRDLEKGRDLADHLKWVKFSSVSWTHDHRGFFYSRYDEPRPGEELQSVNYFPKLYYHRLGTPQLEDELVYHRPDQKEWGFSGSVSRDGQYLIIHVSKGTDRKNALFYKDLKNPQGQVVELLNEFDAGYSFVGNEGPVFWVQTDLNAPRGKLIAIDTRSPQRSNWGVVIGESPHALQGVRVIHNQFVATYLKDAHSEVKFFALDGRFLRDLALPGLGSVSQFRGKRGDPEAFYAFTSFTTPAGIYRYDLEAGRGTVFREPRLSFNPGDYETRLVFYNSKDETRVPMFLNFKKGLPLNGKNPTHLYGYGGFNIPVTPGFSVTNLVWMEMGGIYAVANIRGGGEYGEQWHRAGTRLNKQNVFDDFIAAAEWLIQNQYTSTPKLAISGRSNGGLLVGAAITQRPDLFGAAVPGVGVLDMLRFHKFTIGWAWVSDYGSADNPEEFKALYAYSPYHNVKPGTPYPATLITTADHDDRVVPAHSFKFAAALQAAQEGTEPVLIRIETRAGHGAGKPTSKQIEESADILAFLVRELEVELMP